MHGSAAGRPVAMGATGGAVAGASGVSSGVTTSTPDWTFSDPDWASIGLILAVVGSFLLANSILFRRPLQMVRERFGVVSQDLCTIREYIFHRLQVNLGFGFLLAGFGVQLFSRFRPLPAGVTPPFPVLWIGIVVALAVLLLLASWWWSQRAFRRCVRQHFRENPPDFEADLALAREVGELFGLSTHADDTVESFLARLRLEVCDLPPAGRRAPTRLELEESELEEGLA
ncbi:MAG: hypothetical protein QF903_02690 [Planctomycetota bacterium]|nr:hypothetical protein [Planctomycetota bacterium]MDP6761246.1 hypothetical protein [Planctomycetota bacterium]MDP6988369.1 hypothetical protein [Planctomycetota bacterium]